MNTITSIAALRESIVLLEIKQANEAALLKEQIKFTYENLKPVNLIKNTLSELTSDPDVKGKILNAALGLAAGFVSKKVVIGVAQTPLKQLLGTVLQIAVTGIVAKNTGGIKSVAQNLIKKIFSKKDTLV